MLNLKKELVMPLDDIEAAVIECTKCHFQMRIPITTDPISNQRLNPYDQCLVCNETFDPALRICVEDFRKVVKSSRGKALVSLQINASLLDLKI
jgi:predicted nucleic acid-binding Zn ribbon protein